MPKHLAEAYSGRKEFFGRRPPRDIESEASRCVQDRSVTSEEYSAACPLVPQGCVYSIKAKGRSPGVLFQPLKLLKFAQSKRLIEFLPHSQISSLRLHSSSILSANFNHRLPKLSFLSLAHCGHRCIATIIPALSINHQ